MRKNFTKVFMTATYSSFSVLDDANVTPDVAAAVSSAKLCNTFGVKSVAKLLASILLPVNNTPAMFTMFSIGTWCKCLP
jgi:hypothetical protein